jgi:hypothetical protein
MENNAVTITDQRDTMNFSFLNRSVNVDLTSEAIDILLAEGGEKFYNYVDWLGLAHDPDLIVLSSQHHYYYDPEELNNCNTVINLKELNQIKNIREFLRSCLYFLPQKSHFIGCFIDTEKVNGYELREKQLYNNKKNIDDIENGIVSKFPFINMLYSILDSRTFRYMSKLDVSLLLEDNSFKIINMSEHNGLTFFHSQKELSASN